MIRAGDLEHRIEIWAPREPDTQNPYGEEAGTFTLAATRWGSITFLTGRELAFAAQQQSEATHKVVLRFFEGLTTRHRLVHRGKTYEIESVNDDNFRGIEHEIMVKEGAHAVRSQG